MIYFSLTSLKYSQTKVTWYSSSISLLLQSVHVRCVYRAVTLSHLARLTKKIMAIKSQLVETHSCISSNITIHITSTAKYNFNFFIQSTSITIPKIDEAYLNKFVYQPLLKSSKKHFFIHHWLVVPNISKAMAT